VTLVTAVLKGGRVTAIQLTYYGEGDKVAADRQGAHLTLVATLVTAPHLPIIRESQGHGHICESTVFVPLIVSCTPSPKI
jgi:hypothetical protein